MTVLHRTTFTLVYTLSLLVLLGTDRSRADDTLTKKIDQLVAKLGVTNDSPGLVILIRQPGGVNFSKGYGLANLKNRTAATSKTVFELASASKPITATAVLMLHDQRKLSLDDNIRKHLPELPDYGSMREIKVRDLLNHTSGLPDYMGFPDVPSRHEKYRTNEDFLSQFAEKKDAFPLTFEPGEKYEYNNTNYMLAASLGERVAKKPFAEFMRDQIFAPAGMTSTFVCNSPTSKPKEGDSAAIGYEKRGKNWEPIWGAPPDRYEELLTTGDGAIWSNVEDFARWDAAVRQGKFFGKATAKQALTPSITSDGKTNNYGLGWTLYFDGPRMIGFGHDGFWGGFSTTYYFNTLKKRTTIMLSNGGSYGGDDFWYAVDALVDESQPKRRRK